MNSHFGLFHQSYCHVSPHISDNLSLNLISRDIPRKLCKAEYPAQTLAAAALIVRLYKAKDNCLLLLNPVTDGQFLTFLYNIKRLRIIAKAAYNNLFTINYIYNDNKIENRPMYDSLDICIILL